MSIFKRNNFDLLYQQLSSVDSFKALFFLKKKTDIDKLLKFLIKKKCNLKNENLKFFGSSRQAMMFALDQVSSKKKYKVLTPSFTCEVVPLYILKNNLKPIYYNVSPFEEINTENIISLIDDETCAVIIQHSFGYQEDIALLVEKLRETGIKVIEDKALCFASNRKSLPELQGDFAYYSFESSKSISCGMGGMLISNIESSESDQATNQPINSFFENLMISFQTFLSILLYSNNFKIIQLIRRTFSLIGFLRKSVDREDLNIYLSPKKNTLTNYQKKILIFQLLKLNNNKKAVLSRLNYWESILGNIIDRRYLDNTYPVRLPILVKNGDETRRQLKRAGMLDYHWFTGGIGDLSFDKKLVNFDLEKCTNSAYQYQNIVNLPTIKKIEKKFIHRIKSIIIRNS